MVSITSCLDWEITTIEKIGNRLKGYHPLQTTLAENNGSQCGYCSPGWVMAMYSLIHTNPNLTMLEIEQSFGSNVCRCTGYRPILKAFKKFAKDYPNAYEIPDIEDLSICEKTGKKCNKTCDEEDEWCVIKKEDVMQHKIIEIPLQDHKKWFRVLTVNDIFEVLNQEGYDSYMLVAGNTAKGAYPIKEYPQTLIDISDVSELKRTFIDQNLVIGGGTTLTEALDIFQHMATQDYFEYLLKFYQHLKLVAHIAVRNIGTIAGNLMIKHQHNEFPSDIFLLLETVGAELTLEKVQLARIAYGGLSSTFIRAAATEKYLTGKELFTNDTLRMVLQVLKGELKVVEIPPNPSAAYRKQLAINLFYKGLLSICPEDKIPERYSSAVINLHENRPVSQGIQVYDTNPSLWPLNQPLPKVDGLILCAGEAKYTEDMPSLPEEVYGAFVLSTVPNGKIVSIDPSKALAENGVIAFYTAKDIPGENSFTPNNTPVSIVFEPLLSDGVIEYYHQPIAIIVAKTRKIADRAAELIKIIYSDVRKPIVDIKIAKRDPRRVFLLATMPATEAGREVVKIIKGENTIYGQYPFTMETLVCVTKPTEEGLEVNAATQWLDIVHEMVSRVLNIKQNRIDVKVRRLGGGYGFKVTRVSQTAVACSLVAFKLNKPCRFIQSLSTNMRAMGKRFPCSFDYEAGVDNTGVIQYLNVNLYEDNGYKINEPIASLGLVVYNNCYDSKRWNYKCFNGITDTAKNSWCRSPSTLENIAMAETILERISYELSLDPLQVRLSNLDYANHNDLKEMTSTLVEKADYNSRKQDVQSFNSQNRWKKRGLRFSCMRWKSSAASYLDANLSVYHGDGTVSLTHGGIEMGQGINTKAVQLCAYLLNIPVEKVQIKPNDTTISPNSFCTAASITSQVILVNIRQCCEELLKRLAPIRAQMINPTWEELIKKAFEASVDLQTHGFVGNNYLNDYNVYGVTLAEVEIDVLTGEHEILRVDLLQDVGQSVSPEIDIGQIEGAFTMALGYWTSEHLVYDLTGELLTNRTWNYHVPLARDIPQNFKVYFRKKSYSTDVYFGSKMTGEPSVCMAIVIPFAIREAITAARLENGIPTTSWFNIDGPYTVEEICLATATRLQDFRFKD
ncbi:xanthine dehydrogenase 1-like [Hyposmocoma kahamanoa]|uniref:xanthine dehydrogenase 1-like n=1 Tax=Hyposmocoma kahamanoa TaxID=1477025 RepID=UPI000E6D6BC6|nr:xanthine dehydrogenase 1-like [Hyposmocoma kahamanoa]